MLQCLLTEPFLAGYLSEIKSTETLRRHMSHALEAGFPDIVAEYLAEIRRRDRQLENSKEIAA